MINIIKLIKWFQDMRVFNPNRSFFDLWIVRLTAIAVIGLAYWSYDKIITHTAFIECYTSDCFNNSLTFFKVPLGLLSLLIPIIAVYAANHRSEQTKRQIELSQEQSNFTNHYKHLEEFEKYIKDLTTHTTKYQNLGVHTRKLHASFFVDSSEGVLHITSETNNLISKVYGAAIKVMVDLKNLDSQENTEASREDIFNLSFVLIHQAEILNSNFDIGLSVVGEDFENSYSELLQHENINWDYFVDNMPLLSPLLDPFFDFAEIYLYVADFVPNQKLSLNLQYFSRLKYNHNAKLVCSKAQPFNITKND